MKLMLLTPLRAIVYAGIRHINLPPLVGSIVVGQRVRAVSDEWPLYRLEPYRSVPPIEIDGRGDISTEQIDNEPSGQGPQHQN